MDQVGLSSWGYKFGNKRYHLWLPLKDGTYQRACTHGKPQKLSSLYFSNDIDNVSKCIFCRRMIDEILPNLQTPLRIYKLVPGIDFYDTQIEMAYDAKIWKGEIEMDKYRQIEEIDDDTDLEDELLLRGMSLIADSIIDLIEEAIEEEGIVYLPSDIVKEIDTGVLIEPEDVAIANLLVRKGKGPFSIDYVTAYRRIDADGLWVEEATLVGEEVVVV